MVSGQSSSRVVRGESVVVPRLRDMVDEGMPRRKRNIVRRMDKVILLASLLADEVELLS